MNYSVIRRYTPPTCTLSLLAKKTFLKATPLSELRFELRFDDPRLSDNKQILISDDRSSLERLSDTVSRYVQELIEKLPQLPLSEPGEQAIAASTLAPAVAAQSSTASPSLPQLRSNRLLAHELVYESGTTVQLSTVQLFDLANALESSREDLITLPKLESAKIRKKYAWAGVATAIVLVGIPVSVRILTTSEVDEEVVLQEIETQPRQPDPVEVVPPVPPPPETVLPAPTLAPSLANSEPLSPPAAVTPPPSESLPAPPNTPVAPAPSPPRSTSVIPQTPPSTSTSRSSPPPAVSSPSLKLPELPPLEPHLTEPLPSAAPPDAPAGDVAPNVLLDEIPQVAEARTYFQEEWLPPENLSQVLEYRLVLNSDGSIKQIIPLGQASRVYLDRTGMPLMGEEFVSPPSEAENPQIRVMLDPNGTVRTFLEAP